MGLCLSLLLLFTLSTLGKYRSGDETSIQPPPFAVCQDFAEAVDIIIDSRNS